MSASQLIAKIRRNGGRVWLDELGRLNAEGASDTQMAELARSYDLAVAVLHDQIASVRWEITGKNPKLWRVPECAWTYPDQTIKPLPELVHIWATEKCVGSPRGSTNAYVLHREFMAWVGLGPGSTTQQEFLELMAALSWPSVDGWVDDIALAEDFMPALVPLNRERTCPQEDESKEAAAGPETAGPQENATSRCGRCLRRGERSEMPSRSKSDDRDVAVDALVRRVSLPSFCRGSTMSTSYSVRRTHARQ